MSFNSNLEIHKDHVDLTYEYEPITLSKTKTGTTKDDGKNYMKVRPPRLPSFT